MARIGSTLAAVLLAACAASERPTSAPVFLDSPEAEALSLPFSEAVRVGNLLFLSGQIGNRPGTLDLAPGGIQAETRQTLDNIRTLLARHGSSLDRVAKCTVFLADMGEWPAMNEIYATYFPTNPPARSAFGANGIALGARVEIECIAVATGGSGSPPGP